MDNTRDSYRRLCQAHPEIPVFAQSWWLDSLCGPDGWFAVLAYDAGGKALGAFPFVLKQKWGLRFIDLPPMTPYNYIWINYPRRIKRHTRYSYQRKVIGELIKRLPPYHYFYQTFHPDLDNWLPFYWNGFRQSTRYTYLLENVRRPEEALLADMKGNARRNIQKGDRQLEVEQEVGLDDFYRLCLLTFERQGLDFPYSFKLIKRMDGLLAEHNCRKILGARDKRGRLHGAVYLTWYGLTGHCLFTASDPDLRHSAAIYLLYWSALRSMPPSVHRFDFEGSMLSNVEPVYAALGAIRRPYYAIFKSGNRVLSLLSLLLGKNFH